MVMQVKMRYTKRQEKIINYFEGNFSNDRGQPISLKDRPYLIDIYTNNFPSVVLACARQVGKSTYIGVNLLYEALKKGGDSMLYTNISAAHLNDFNQRKFKLLLENNPKLKEGFRSLVNVDNREMLTFKNGSFIYFRARDNSPKSALGITARKIYCDEFQNASPKDLAMILECSSSFGDDASFVFCGTPTTHQDLLWSKYERSNMCEWIVHCQHCQKNLPPLDLSNIDKDKPYLFCTDCGKKVDPLYGRWIAQNPNSAQYGYRISRLMDPNAAWHNSQGSGILDLYDEYSVPQFLNNVMGLPAETGVTVLSEAEVLACCGDYEFIDPKDAKSIGMCNDLIMAVDWAYRQDPNARSFTCYAIGDVHNGRIRIVYAKRFVGPRLTAEDEINEMREIAHRLQIKLIATDFSIGHKENLRLRESLSTPVHEYQYTGGSRYGSFDEKSECYQVNKTLSLDITTTMIQRQKFQFPRAQFIKPFMGDLTEVKRIFNEEKGTVTYPKPPHSPDDFLQVLNYMQLAFRSYFRYFPS